MLTGLYPSEHGAVSATTSLAGHPLPDDVRPLAEVLRQRGYLTVGSVAAPLLRERYGFHRGFVHYDDEWRGFDRSATDVFERALQLAEGADDRPLFLFLNFFDAHTPFVPRGWDEADRALLEANDIDVDHFAWTELRRQGRNALPEEVLDALERRYHEEIRQLDADLGRLFERLEAAGRLDDAVVAIVADHGEAFGEKGFHGHGGPAIQSEARVPFLFGRWNGEAAARRIAEPVSLVDVAPMLLAEIGVSDPSFAKGRGPGAPVYFERFSEHASMRMVADGDYRLLLWRKGHPKPSGREELQAIAVDGDDLSAEEPERLQALLDHFEQLVGERGLAPEFAPGSSIGPATSAASGAGDTEMEEQLRRLGYIE